MQFTMHALAVCALAVLAVLAEGVASPLPTTYELMQNVIDCAIARMDDVPCDDLVAALGLADVRESDPATLRLTPWSPGTEASLLVL